MFNKMKIKEFEPIIGLNNLSGKKQKFFHASFSKFVSPK